MLICALRVKLEDAFSKQMSSAHLIASTVPDMFLLARNLYTTDLAKPRGPK